MSDLRKINNVEIFRGICALVVVIWHYLAHIRHEGLLRTHHNAYEIITGLKNVFLDLSTYAVLGFFIISGFVITRSVVQKTFVNDSFGLYFINRFLRLVSLCLPATLLTVPLSYWYRTSHDITNAWDKYSTFTAEAIIKSALGFSAQWNGPGWTLKHEWIFYLLVAIPFLLRKPSPKNLAMAGVITIFVFVCMPDYAFNPVNIAFLSGIAALILFGRVKTLFAHTRYMMLAASLGFIAWQVVAFDNSYTNAWLRCIPLFVVMLFVLYEGAYAGRLYAALTYLGRISFSLYIWHWPIFMFGAWFYEGTDTMHSYSGVLFLTFVLVPLAFLAAHYSYLYIERNARLEKIPPLYKLYLKLAHRKANPPPAAPSPW